ncbi:MAG: 16S rRNA (cytidine(1402)-2'-O)-methyltransferase [Candidatus Omnitrophica bacterium]|nr:16S rRNA (cytidine(1402)-2'-O)-methyltransferase [Candidatus Omnitrophota bacterium]MBU0881342.1 16S rRNA (cytidine(1402)-2'-O)-methyltransferase [Candidatus Omnitrophota bacterium]MBU0895236.1 16S rRNA (cytidine(1402)-2'-O)-methyltransferase [Candidatus Omnitrophota bacterium]MBU1808940.1 16S rRNA (cytidine(1402)-2'-O)-methyltransferase [Candidatus Omnitrophota bacterium]
MPGTLYIVSTPIGNLADMTLRGIEMLKSVDLIAAEDTRHTKILLDRYQIPTRMTSYFEYNKIQKTEYLLEVLREGKSVALVSDAGTPGISDPGYRIIRMCIDNNIPVIPVPGASGLLTALVVSGKPTDKFTFEGFLSNKPIKRKKQLKKLKDEARTVVLYESPHRIVKLLADILEVYGDVEIVIAREMTKKFEELRREKASDALGYFKSAVPKGEFIVVI